MFFVYFCTIKPSLKPIYDESEDIIIDYGPDALSRGYGR
jgi:hypothetical protein